LNSLLISAEGVSLNSQPKNKVVKSDSEFRRTMGERTLLAHKTNCAAIDLRAHKKLFVASGAGMKISELVALIIVLIFVANALVQENTNATS